MTLSCAEPMRAPEVIARGAFELGDDVAYRRWRDRKLRQQPRSVEDMIVDVVDPRRLTPAERDALLRCIARANMAVYRSPVTAADKALPRQLGVRLGLHRLDANWLGDEDGISPITVDPGRGDAGEGGGAYIPYTERAINWHTDGYYHPAQRRIHAMILHCVHAATEGGDNLLMDHELAYIALRDADPAWLRALMADDAMSIPARLGEGGVARVAQAGPVFSVDATSGALHMRYTARTRSIEWKNDAATRDAVAFLRELLDRDAPGHFRLRLQPGMGLVGHNVLHARSAFVDGPARPRLLYRARYLDRIAPGTTVAG
jgi:alpha-ketoglutarate-dependent taurine dioxygenase